MAVWGFPCSRLSSFCLRIDGVTSRAFTVGTSGLSVTHIIMDVSLSMLILLMSATLVLGQRPFFAGLKPIGFPDTPNKTDDGLGDRFGEDGTTPKLPIEAHGDVGFADRLSKLPIDKQPFWFINWQAYEAERNNPQTYPQRPNPFLDPIPTSNNANSGAADSNSGTSNSGLETPSSNSEIPNINSGASNLNSAPSNSDSTANRFGEPDSSSNVKPTVLPTSDGNKNSQTKPNTEVKPITTEALSTGNKKEDSSSKTESTVPNSDSTNTDSNKGNKTEEVAPIVPNPIEPEPTVADGLNLKVDSNDSKKLRYFRGS